MSARDALNKYYQNQLPKERKAPRKKRNAKPEAELEKHIRALFVELKFSMNKIESKAVYNVQAGTYLRGQTDAGVSDYVGCDPSGYGAFVEVKAPGKRSTLKPHQRAFLEDKINKGAFACCVDSVELLYKTWHEWQVRRLMEKMLARTYLLRALPRQGNMEDSFDLA
jgi:hypothetical protein